MKEGHRVWNNVVLLSKGGKRRGKGDAFYNLCDVFLSPWYCSKQLAKFGFASLTTGVKEYVEAHPDQYDVKHLDEVLAKKERRFAPGNALHVVWAFADGLLHVD